jgi:hypothetical protein
MEEWKKYFGRFENWNDGMLERKRLSVLNPVFQNSIISSFQYLW